MKIASKRKLIVSAVIIVCACGFVWLSFGVYSDREFGGLHLFRKHQLCARFFFYSPHGDSDRPDSTEAERSAEHDYTDFVECKGGKERSWTIYP